jgi:PIN domain nuclease of toxin-antitoxin system
VGIVKQLLLDACTLIWLASDPKKLSKKATRVLNDRSSNLVLSDVTVWEISLKWSAGKMVLPDPPSSWIENQVELWHMTRLPIDVASIYKSTELPSHHKDPFDRLMVAQALVHRLVIVTPDESVAAYPVSTIW